MSSPTGTTPATASRPGARPSSKAPTLTARRSPAARGVFGPEHHDFRDSFRRFLAVKAVPHVEAWEAAGSVPREFWSDAAAQGFVGFELPEELGGAGVEDFRFNAIVAEEVEYAAVAGDNFSLQNDIIVPYLLELANAEQRERWFHGFTAGELLFAIAMSEPGAGSDLRAMAMTATRRNGEYVLSGSKTFITSGIQADRIIVAAREGRGFGLFVVEAAAAGFERGRKLEKIGRKAQDTAELFFNDVVVSEADRLGAEGEGLRYLMARLPRERLSIAVSAVAAAERALELTLEYVRERKAFGQPIGSFQANRFTLARHVSEVAAARSHVDFCILALGRGELDAAEAAAVKASTTDLQFRVLDDCLQLHGGYGYMEEYPIARLWRDARVQRIYGGTNEIMYDIVGRGLGL